ncbi:hypothetical protein NQ318_008064 [Aromia moschata]|uniref:Reverse transcriptase zinc-binding domain-containing protein n=1 Tax=Aromia moschata TaxID=1265417 RepID=A0AAV8YPE0_9CUCU|nr:hypothetical protein NQ318_008064 [Aromia moschata]
MVTKYIIQLFWTLGLDWDQSPPNDVLLLWDRYKRELPLLSQVLFLRRRFQYPLQVQIPRQIKIPDNWSCEYHGFCDASSKGYSAVVYFRVLGQNSDVSVYCVCAKSKIAPLRRISIPRFELCAAVLLSDLISFVLFTYDAIKFSKIFAWSDSTVTLAWIKSSPHRWKTFVSNRVSFIQDKISPENWLHISSKNNPAALASRGLFPSELFHNSLWWAGPAFLKDASASSVIPSEIPLSEEAFQEERKTSLNSVASTEFFETLLNNYSSLNHLQCVIAYILRFVFNLKNPANRHSLSLSFFDLNQALLILIKYTQQKHFFVLFWMIRIFYGLVVACIIPTLPMIKKTPSIVAPL